MACSDDLCDDGSIHEAWAALSAYLTNRDRLSGLVTGGSGPKMGELLASHPEWVMGLIEATRRHIAPIDLMFGADVRAIEKLVNEHPMANGGPR